jgi:predicted regulator of Ras-like GTPase activity (Roadblock/LC7/MglB family)
VVSGIGSLTVGAAKLLEFGGVRQTMIAMDEGSLFVTAISDGSLLGAHASPDCDMSVVAYHMALFVGRAGHVLTPELRSELRDSMERKAGPVRSGR